MEERKEARRFNDVVVVVVAIDANCLGIRDPGICFSVSTRTPSEDIRAESSSEDAENAELIIAAVGCELVMLKVLVGRPSLTTV